MTASTRDTDHTELNIKDEVATLHKEKKCLIGLIVGLILTLGAVGGIGGMVMEGMKADMQTQKALNNDYQAQLNVLVNAGGVSEEDLS